MGGPGGEGCFVCDSECMCRGDWAWSSADRTPLKGLQEFCRQKTSTDRLRVARVEPPRRNPANQPGNLGAFHRALSAALLSLKGYPCAEAILFKNALLLGSDFFMLHVYSWKKERFWCSVLPGRRPKVTSWYRTGLLQHMI